MGIKTRKLKGSGLSRGVRVTEKNYLEVAKWASKHVASVATHKQSILGDASDQKVRLRLPGKGWRVAKVGDIVAIAKFESDPKNPLIYVIKKDESEGFEK